MMVIIMIMIAMKINKIQIINTFLGVNYFFNLLL
jgi:hypothetical protein